MLYHWILIELFYLHALLSALYSLFLGKYIFIEELFQAVFVMLVRNRRIVSGTSCRLLVGQDCTLQRIS